MFRFFLYCFLFLAFCIAFSFAYAASSYTVQGNVYRVVDYVDSDAERIRLRTVLKGAAANEPFAARVVPITQSRFASWFKPNLGSLIKSNLWWMGFVAIVESAGWAIDELKGQVQVVRRPAGVEMGYYWCPVDAMNNLDLCGISVVKSAEKKFSQWSFYAGDVQCGSPDYSGWVRCSFRRNDANYRGEGVFARQACSPGSTIATCGDPAALYEPVPDADLQSLVNTQLALDPAHAATAFTDPATGRGYDELFDPVPYIPGLTAADEALVNCYVSGQLQMVNSQTACYVANQAEYDRIKQQTEALASAKTPEATADALNSQMKQPLTQAQYEESNLKAETSQTAALATSLAPALDPFNELKVDSDFVLDKVTNPAEPPAALAFISWTSSTGVCSGFNVDFSVGNGKLHTSKRVNEFCDFYSSVAHPLLYWFLNILTFLYVWWVWDRSVSDMAR